MRYTYALLATKGQIKSTIGRGSFTVPQPNHSERQFLLALNIDLDHCDMTNAWAYTIYGAIPQAALTSGRNVILPMSKRPWPIPKHFKWMGLSSCLRSPNSASVSAWNSPTHRLCS